MAPAPVVRLARVASAPVWKGVEVGIKGGEMIGVVIGLLTIGAVGRGCSLLVGAECERYFRVRK